MELPKKKKDDKEAASAKVQSIDTAKKGSARTGTAKPVKAKKAETPKKSAKKAGEPAAPAAWLNTARQYLREVGYELRKVVWPSRKETIGSTAVVLVIVGLSATYLGIIDFFLSRLMRLFIG